MRVDDFLENISQATDKFMKKNDYYTKNRTKRENHHPERDVRREITDVLAVKAPHVKLWKNNVGAVNVNGRWIRYGLCPGSSDWVGIIPRVVTQDDVGTTIGVFLAAEAKAPRGRVSDRQSDFLLTVKKLGGITGVWRSVEDALNTIGGINGKED